MVMQGGVLLDVGALLRELRAGAAQTREEYLTDQYGGRSLEDIEDAMASVGLDIVERLALGPLEEPLCRLCDTMNELRPAQGSVEADEVYWRKRPQEETALIALLDFHELLPHQLNHLSAAMNAAGITARDAMDNHINGVLSLLIYARCQLIYETARRTLERAARESA